MAGISLVIGNGHADCPLARIVEQGVGTLFLPRKAKGARKAWLGGRLRMRGRLIIDAGAAVALRDGASLLAKGIVEVEGTFDRGDPVAIVDLAGAVIAHGLCEYNSTECTAIRWLHSDELASVLGYAPRSAVVHRDQMVLKWHPRA